MDRINDGMARRLLQIPVFVVLLAVSEVTSVTECFYELGTIRGVTYLGSMYCQYGCCGTSQNQRCCTREEKFPDEKEGRVWRIVAMAFAGVILVLVLSLVACWVLKKKNRKTVRVRASNYSATAVQSTPSRHGYDTQRDIFAIDIPEANRNSQPPAYSYLPKYPDTVFNEGGGGTGTQHTNGYADVTGASHSGDGLGTDTAHQGSSLAQQTNHQQRPLSPPPSYAP